MTQGSAKTAIPPTTLVCVTFNRAEFLRDFLTSAAALAPAPERVIVVDNASTDNTPGVLAEFIESGRFAEFIVHREPVNTGGAGGFHRGVHLACELGATWIWMMDDDVEVVPDSLARLHQWTTKYRCLQGRRDDVDGSPFRWQPYVHEPTMLPVKRRGPEFDRDGSVSINSGTFEGMLIHRDVVGMAGLPDPRFFLVWDDIIFGWLVSRHEPVGYVDEVVLRRKPKQRRIAVGDRNVNAGSARHRYYVVRNRALVRHYVKHHNALKPTAFGIGSAVVVAKEIARMLITERSLNGLADLQRGWRDGQAIQREQDWQPAPTGRAAYLSTPTTNES